jgi:hypothetical protein
MYYLRNLKSQTSNLKSNEESIEKVPFYEHHLRGFLDGFAAVPGNRREQPDGRGGK